MDFGTSSQRWSPSVSAFVPSSYHGVSNHVNILP
jgi:hypothetical protein